MIGYRGLERVENEVFNLKNFSASRESYPTHTRVAKRAWRGRSILGGNFWGSTWSTVMRKQSFFPTQRKNSRKAPYSTNSIQATA